VLYFSRYVGCESPTSVHSEFVPRRGFDGQLIGAPRRRRFVRFIVYIISFVSLDFYLAFVPVILAINSTVMVVFRQTWSAGFPLASLSTIREGNLRDK